MTRQRMTTAKRWVVKVGSSLLTADGVGLDEALIESWCNQIAELKSRGIEMVLVSSGSIAEGMGRLELKTRPRDLPTLQAAAAVGQMGLVRAYEKAFEVHGLRTAQILLTDADLANRQRYLNARATLRRLLELDTVPVINENDSVTTEEIRFGDNDTLAALVANLIAADLLIILTDQDGLFTADPRTNPGASLLERADAKDPETLALAGTAGTQLGSGGMRTKVTAASRAAVSGTTTIIANGREPQVLQRLAAGELLGTMLTSDQPPRMARKQWLSNQLKSNGKLWVDKGAEEALKNRGVSLLAIGVTRVEGRFKRGEMVSCLSQDGIEIAKGLSNYDNDAAALIAGKPSEAFGSILGFAGEPELINRDNLVLVDNPDLSVAGKIELSGSTEPESGH